MYSRPSRDCFKSWELLVSAALCRIVVKSTDYKVLGSVLYENPTGQV